MDRVDYRSYPRPKFLSYGSYRLLEDGEMDDPKYVGVKSYITGYNKLFKGRKMGGKPIEVIATPVIHKKDMELSDNNYSVSYIHDRFFSPGHYMLPYVPVPEVPGLCHQPNVMAHVLTCPAEGVRMPRALPFSDYRYTTGDRNPGEKIGACLNAVLPEDLPVIEDQIADALFNEEKVRIVNHHCADNWVHLVAPKKVFDFLEKNPKVASLYPRVVRSLKDGIVKLMDPSFRKLKPEVKVGFEQFALELQQFHGYKPVWNDLVKKHPYMAHFQLGENFREYGVLEWTPDEIQDLHVTSKPVPGYYFRTPFSSYMKKIVDNEGPAEAEGAASSADEVAAGSRRQKRKTQEPESTVEGGAAAAGPTKKRKK